VKAEDWNFRTRHLASLQQRVFRRNVDLFAVDDELGHVAAARASFERVLALYTPEAHNALVTERPSVPHLTKFRGVVQVDGYPGFDRFSEGGRIQLAGCWAHARRKFDEVQQATGSPIAAEAPRHIAELYAIETTIQGQRAGARQSMRQSKSMPLVANMKVWFETQLIRVPPRSGLADAIRDPLGCPLLFLDDGRVELDTNTVERAIRPVALGRKNHLGGGERWAIVCSLIATAELNNIEPFAYLKDVIERMSNGHLMSQLDDLLPWNWRPSIALN
jgi:transposase